MIRVMKSVSLLLCPIFCCTSVTFLSLFLALGNVAVESQSCRVVYHKDTAKVELARAQVRACACVCMCMYPYVCPHELAHAHVHADPVTWSARHISHDATHTHAHIRARTHTHTHTHTHTRKGCVRIVGGGMKIGDNGACVMRAYMRGRA